MGIYPNHRNGPMEHDPETNLTTWTEYREYPGVVETRTVTATPWQETERTDCYCCSCPEDRPGADPACRNHGWAAQRPCEVHNMPGQPWETGDGNDGEMPESVQAVRPERTRPPRTEPPGPRPAREARGPA